MRGFGDLESVIMDRLWSWDRPSTVRDVLESLLSEREIAYTTVMTVMDNLHSKGWLKRKLSGRAYVYRTVASRQEYSAGLMREALDASRDADETLVHFAQMSEEERTLFGVPCGVVLGGRDEDRPEPARVRGAARADQRRIGPG